MTSPMKNKREIRLSENLRRIMDSKRITVTSTARKVGMNKSTLHGYCNGVVPRNLRKLNELADFLEIPITELVFGSDSEFTRVNYDGPIEGCYEVIIRKVNETGVKKR